MIVVVFAHPYPSHSRACAALLAAIADLPDIEVRSLYELYPDFDIDAAAERAAVERAELLVWLHPLYWFGAPALFKHWLDHVLSFAWTTGQDSISLQGKDCLWVTTTGGDLEAFETLEAPLQRTARYCGMNWLEPFHASGAREVSDEALHEAGMRLKARLDEWAKGRKAA